MWRAVVVTASQFRLRIERVIGDEKSRSVGNPSSLMMSADLDNSEPFIQRWHFGARQTILPGSKV
jgi:hypothetical protein